MATSALGYCPETEDTTPPALGYCPETEDNAISVPGYCPEVKGTATLVPGYCPEVEGHELETHNQWIFLKITYDWAPRVAGPCARVG